VFRVHIDSGATCVVKVVRQGNDEDPGELWVSGAEPAHRNYWKREWLAFDCGLLDRLPGRLRAPRRLLTTEHDDGECWIWMEDVTGRHAATLTLDDYATIAFDAGTTHGAYAAGTASLPDDGWLSRRWLRGWVGACERLLGDVDDARVHALWAAREDLLAIVESAPSTLVHCDFWPANLYVTDGATVAIDWSQVGIGAVAQDLDQVTLDTVWMQVRPDESLDRLEELILPSYGAGLRAAGLDVADADIRRWYAAAAGAHYPWLAGIVTLADRDPERAAAMEQRFGRPFAAVVADRMRVVERAIALGEEALGSAG
jgi:aminoglycoside phosphotransferase (APT) family kinase protein